MAKGVTLIDTQIRELRVNITDGDADVQTLVVVMDDQGNSVNYQTIKEKFSDMSVQRMDALNNYFRLSSQKFNNDVVNENKDSWKDL
jgi:Fe-S cluster assembly scaffold protein SufB